MDAQSEPAVYGSKWRPTTKGRNPFRSANEYLIESRKQVFSAAIFQNLLPPRLLDIGRLNTL